MNEVLEIAKYILPSVVTAGVIYFVFDSFYKKEERKRWVELKTETAKISLPVRMQAYERLVLLMERISPGTLVMRVNTSGLTGRQMHAELLKALRSEFDHNITQQVYISRTAWEAVKNAKEETVKLVNYAASTMDDNASGTDLAKTILEMTMKLENLPTQVACDVLRDEAARLY
ncbi:MAG: hypothetical protein MH137_14020 [Flavobacteriales bacterium]|nr:hypothetical protein [Flavobacteriales bacterium]